MRIRMGTLAVLLVMTAGAQTPAKRLTLSGTVVDAVSLRPMAAIDLSLQTDSWDSVGDAVTDSQGRFAFPGLAAGDYVLSATGAFGNVRYGETGEIGWVSALHVGTKAQDKNVVFAILPRGSIEGVVRDEFGDPLNHAAVWLLRTQWRDGRTVSTVTSQKGTDDRGRYRFTNMPPGNYFLCVNTQSSSAAPMQGTVDFAARVDNRFYVRTCYPTGTGASSRPFQLAPGQRAQIDLVPMIAATATVQGHVRGAASQNASIFMSPDDTGDGMPQNFGAGIDPNLGTFTIRGVPPGRYRLRADTHPPMGQTPLFAEQVIEVGGSSVEGLELTLEPGATLDMTFHANSESQAELSRVGGSLRQADPSRVTRGAPREKDGTYKFSPLPPGRYWLTTFTPRGICVDSVKLGEREMRGLTLEVTNGAALKVEVHVTSHCGEVQTRVVRDGIAAPGAKLVMLRSGTPKDPGEIVEDVANDEGQFSFTGLAPGHYLIWAWTVDGNGASAAPSSLAAVEAQATAVDVTAGDAVKIDIPILKEAKGQ